MNIIKKIEIFKVQLSLLEEACIQNSMEFCKVADLVGVKTESKDDSSSLNMPSSGMLSARKRANDELKRILDRENDYKKQ